MYRMLLGETQQDLATAMVEFFSVINFTVQLEQNGLRILELLRQAPFDVIVLELALPALDGIGIVRSYRASGGISPVLLLTGQHCSDELKLGLESGADAYVVKPFRLRDLASQIEALLRRPALRSELVLESGSIALNSQAVTVTRYDEKIHLHPMEFKLLQFLLRHPNQVFSSQALFQRVWQRSRNSENTVRTHIRTLRQKIDCPGEDSIITTVRGFGYMAEMSDQHSVYPSRSKTA